MHEKNPAEDEGPERIRQENPAALEYDGKRYVGPNHGIAYNLLYEEHPKADELYVQEGFMTTRGRFVDRQEAKQIADRHDQTRGVGGKSLIAGDIKQEDDK